LRAPTRRRRFYNPLVNEFELIERFFARAPRHAHVRVGVGDDAAIIGPKPNTELAVSVDMLVSGRHFFPDTDPEGLGHKTLAVNLSDMAAMGALPRWALLAGALPRSDTAWLAAFAKGFFALADAYHVELIGGDTTQGPLNLCVTIIGELPVGKGLLRSGARLGDDVWVSGRLGDAALGFAALERHTELAPDALARCRARLERPHPRVRLGLALRSIASAALDISDGLTGDLSHILERSKVGARVELSRLPRSAWLDAKLNGPERELALHCLLAGGDDYELCFTAPPNRRQEVKQISERERCILSRIGTITEGRTLEIRDEQGDELAAPAAFDHFAIA
jgi:thiamine-monophosphate kinase